MSNGDLGWITNFIWGIADDVLRDLYVRGKYRDVILPMTVLRRLDAVLEPTKKAVMDMKATLDKAGSRENVRSAEDAVSKVYAWNERKKRFSPRQIGIAFETLRAKGWLQAA